MQKVIIPLGESFPYKDDVMRIVRILKERGIECAPLDAQFLWEEYSESMAAGWMTLPDADDEVHGCISLALIKYTHEV